MRALTYGESANLLDRKVLPDAMQCVVSWTDPLVANRHQTPAIAETPKSSTTSWPICKVHLMKYLEKLAH